MTSSLVKYAMKYFKSLILTLLCISFLGISPIHAKTQHKRKPPIKDAAITATIMEKFAKNEVLAPLKIEISTHHGVVSLSGNVKNKEAFVDALRLTKGSPGVVSVDTDDLLITKVNNVFTDAYITTRAEAAILKAKVFDDESIPLVGINATTTNGTVTLSGDVKKNQSIVAIIKRVNAIPGVKKIISRLQVSNKDG